MVCARSSEPPARRRSQNRVASTRNFCPSLASCMHARACRMPHSAQAGHPPTPAAAAPGGPSASVSPPHTRHDSRESTGPSIESCRDDPARPLRWRTIASHPRPATAISVAAVSMPRAASRGWRLPPKSLAPCGAATTQGCRDRLCIYCRQCRARPVLGQARRRRQVTGEFASAVSAAGRRHACSR